MGHLLGQMIESFEMLENQARDNTASGKAAQAEPQAATHAPAKATIPKDRPERQTPLPTEERRVDPALRMAGTFTLREPRMHYKKIANADGTCEKQLLDQWEKLEKERRYHPKCKSGRKGTYEEMVALLQQQDLGLAEKGMQASLDAMRPIQPYSGPVLRALQTAPPKAMPMSAEGPRQEEGSVRDRECERASPAHRDALSIQQ